MNQLEKTKKTLLIATDSFVPRWDGIARFLVDIIPYLVDEFSIILVAPDYKGTSSIDFGDSVQVIRIPLFESISVGDYSPATHEHKTLKKLVQKSDIVWTHTIAPIGELAIHYAKKLGKPYLSYIHSIDWQLVGQVLNKYNMVRKPLYWYTKHLATSVFKRAQLLMVPSAEVEEIFAYNNIRVRKEIVPLGVNLKRFSPSLNKADAKVKLGISPDARVIGFVNRISREKDLLTLYRAFLNLEKKIPNLMLLVVGEGTFSQQQHMEQNPKVKMVGAQSDVIPYLHAMDVFVLPSLLETTSLATLEAMACQIPVVCTPVGLVKEYITEKKNGMLFPKGNSLVLSLKLEWLLTHHHERDEIARAGRYTVTSEYNLEKTAAHVLKILKGI